MVIDDPFVSRDQLRVTEVEGRLRVENLSRHTPIHIVGGNGQLEVAAAARFRPAAGDHGRHDAHSIRDGNETATAPPRGKRFCSRPAWPKSRSPR